MRVSKVQCHSCTLMLAVSKMPLVLPHLEALVEQFECGNKTFPTIGRRDSEFSV